jgi:hypothetical protein
MTMRIIEHYEADGRRVEAGFYDDYEPGDSVGLTSGRNFMPGPYADAREWRDGVEIIQPTTLEKLLLSAGAFAASATITGVIIVGIIWWMSAPAKADTVVLGGTGAGTVQETAFTTPNDPRLNLLVDFLDPASTITIDAPGVLVGAFADPVISFPGSPGVSSPETAVVDGDEIAVTMTGLVTQLGQSVVYAPAIFTAFDLEPSSDLTAGEPGAGFNIAVLSAASLAPMAEVPASPEISTLAMLGIGLAAMFVFGKRGRARSAAVLA